MEQAGNEAQGVTDTISNGETALWMKEFFQLIMDTSIIMQRNCMRNGEVR